MAPEHLDVLVIGAGLSGIGAAVHLQSQLPGHRVLILEARETIGGTWDLFRYPGVRSDSDMYTLGYRFKPWTNARAIADASAILGYIRETADEYAITGRIRFGHRVISASWSSHMARWEVIAASKNGETAFTCSFLYTCTGYYDYAAGYTPEWKDAARFTGTFVHPQHWPANLDYEGKQVLVIGSGATAVTLVPAMASQAAHVTMLQRSPTYILKRPSNDGVADTLRAIFPERAAYTISRWKNILLGMVLFKLARRYPHMIRAMLTRGVRRSLGPQFDVARHFVPRYNPWDERLCLVPDNDLFDAITTGKASIVTDEIVAFTERGVALRSGQAIDADIVVTATGLVVQVLGGIQVVVDGQVVKWPDVLAYKGMMYSDVPNLASAFGYTNASWTLKCDLTGEYVCRLLRYMQANGYVQCTPRQRDPDLVDEPLLDFTSGYVQRAVHKLPRQGTRPPWRVHQDYVQDLIALRFGRVDDGVMEFR